MVDTDIIEVGFTQFIDFTLKRDVSRVNFVSQVKNQGPYHPGFDFWKQLRDEIRFIHQSGRDINELDALLAKVNDKKINQYLQAIAQYKKFCRGKNIEFFDVEKSSWVHDRLFVKSTPEMGLIINGQPYLVKIYFKEHKHSLDQRRANALLALMSDSISKINIPKVKHAVLNIKKGRMFLLDKKINDTMRLALEVEANSFIHIWNNL